MRGMPVSMSFVSIVGPWGVCTGGTCGALHDICWVEHVLSLRESARERMSGELTWE